MRALAALALLVAAPAVARDAAPVRVRVATPADLYGPLFEAVQMRQIFPDGKTFVDAVARRPAAAIVADYVHAAPLDDTALKAFVLANFTVPGEPQAPPPTTRRPPIAEHIRDLWTHLARPPLRPVAGSSALALPAPYVVPGGRFREPYYWDSWFTMLGLRADGRDDLIEGMLADFTSLIDRYGHIPNGARTYYVSRSQPPFFYLMLDLSKETSPAVLSRRLAALKAEHGYWMRGADTLTPAHRAAFNVVRMPDGAVLNRYWDDRDSPRDESWREDVVTARDSGRPAGDVYRDLRAAAESGWDFSSRWLDDPAKLATIRTTAIVPVDLNSLLYGQERAIAARCRSLGDTACARAYAAMAERRRAAIERWLWNPAGGFYGDYNWQRSRLRPDVTAATAFPLFTGVASPARADATAATITRRLVAPGGLRTTGLRTGQQWDAPNGWAPLQWIAIEGLARTGHAAAAQTIAAAFLATVQREYQTSGKLLEKYDVEERRPGGGGEYPTQDGFGWTNGVVRAIQTRYGPLAGASRAP